MDASCRSQSIENQSRWTEIGPALSYGAQRSVCVCGYVFKHWTPPVTSKPPLIFKVTALPLLW